MLEGGALGTALSKQRSRDALPLQPLQPARSQQGRCSFEDHSVHRLATALGPLGHLLRTSLVSPSPGPQGALEGPNSSPDPIPPLPEPGKVPEEGAAGCALRPATWAQAVTLSPKRLGRKMVGFGPTRSPWQPLHSIVTATQPKAVPQ